MFSDENSDNYRNFNTTLEMLLPIYNYQDQKKYGLRTVKLIIALEEY